MKEDAGESIKDEAVITQSNPRSTSIAVTDVPV